MNQHTFSIGEPTPFGPLPEGAALVLGPATQAIVISLRGPRPKGLHAQLPTTFAPIAAPNARSVRRDIPRHMTGLCEFMFGI